MLGIPYADDSLGLSLSPCPRRSGVTTMNSVDKRST
jgi:hypothetical protein